LPAIAVPLHLERPFRAVWRDRLQKRQAQLDALAHKVSMMLTTLLGDDENTVLPLPFCGFNVVGA
jgi:hypothetical protein